MYIGERKEEDSRNSTLLGRFFYLSRSESGLCRRSNITLTTPSLPHPTPPKKIKEKKRGKKKDVTRIVQQIRQQVFAGPTLTMERSFEGYFQDHRNPPDGLDLHPGQPRPAPILTSAAPSGRYSTSWLLGGSTPGVSDPGGVPRVAPPPSPTQVR